MTTKSQHFHIVLRPRLDLLPELAEVREFIERKLEPKNYIISQEKGNSTTNEVYNHYDIVIEIVSKTDKAKDGSSLRRSIKRYWNWDTQTMYNVKVHEVKPPRDIKYQIGYALKEQINYLTTYTNDYLDECREFHKENPLEDGARKTWTFDQAIEIFNDYLLETWKGQKYNAEMVTKKFITWSRKQFQEKNLTASTFQRIQPKRIGMLLANSNLSYDEITGTESDTEGGEVIGPGDYQEEKSP